MLARQGAAFRDQEHRAPTPQSLHTPSQLAQHAAAEIEALSRNRHGPSYHTYVNDFLFLKKRESVHISDASPLGHEVRLMRHDDYWPVKGRHFAIRIIGFLNPNSQAPSQLAQHAAAEIETLSRNRIAGAANPPHLPGTPETPGAVRACLSLVAFTAR